MRRTSTLLACAIFLACALALALANRGRAADLARVLGEMARRSEPATVQDGTPDQTPAETPTMGLDQAFLARITGKTTVSTPPAEPKGVEAAVAELHGAAATMVDPMVSLTSGEESAPAGEVVVTDEAGYRPQHESVASEKLINPLAGGSQSQAIEAPSRVSPPLMTNAEPSDSEHEAPISGKIVDPLAPSRNPPFRSVAEVQTAVESREGNANDQAVGKAWDFQVSRTSAEAVAEPNRSGSNAGSSTQNALPRPTANAPARLAQKQPDPYLDALVPAQTPAPAGLMPAAQHAVQRPQGVTTTYIDPNCAETDPIFDLTAEALVWRLEHTRGQPMILNPLLGRTIRTSSLDLGYQAGPRLSMDFLSDEEEAVHSFEIGYFGVYNWFDRITEIAPAGTFLRLPDVLGSPGVTMDFSAADAMVARYQARVNSVELNAFFGPRDASFHWGIGPRFIRWEEEFLLESFTTGRVSNYQVDTLNDLWGLQWVGRYRRTRGCWELSGLCKVGIYENKATQSTLMTDNNRTVVLRDFSPSDNVAALVVEGGITAAYQFNGTWLARFGYNVFYMDNVARATDQLDFSNNSTSGNRLFFRQDALAHGFNCGLEARW